MRGRQAMASEPYVERLKFQARIPWATQKLAILLPCPLLRDLRVMLLDLEAGGCHQSLQEREGQYQKPKDEHRHHGRESPEEKVATYSAQVQAPGRHSPSSGSHW